MEVLKTIVVYNTFVSVLARIVVSSSSSESCVFSFQNNGRSFSFNTMDCPGGIVFKQRVLIQWMCSSHGYFLGRSNGCSLKSSILIGGPNTKCIYSKDGIMIQAFTPFEIESRSQHPKLFYKKYGLKIKNAKYYVPNLIGEINLGNSTKIALRMKNTENLDLSKKEHESKIWNGTAYCLQKDDSKTLQTMRKNCLKNLKSRKHRKIRSVLQNYQPSSPTDEIRALTAQRLLRSSNFGSYSSYPPGAPRYARYRPAEFPDSYPIAKRQTSFVSPGGGYGLGKSMRPQNTYAAYPQKHGAPTEPEAHEPLQRFCPPICSKPPYTHKLNVTINIVNKPRRIYVSYN